MGTLWDRILERTERAMLRGALCSIETEPAFLEDGGVRFLVRIVANLERKARERNAGPPVDPNFNPFLPYDDDMYVADVSNTHLCLLNKFNVVDHHILIVTRAFEPQDSLLSVDDFDALWRCMSEFPSLGFYNAGQIAGASQRHKHLQLVPLPLCDSGVPIPVAPLLQDVAPGLAHYRARLPFLHAFTRFQPSLVREPAMAAQHLADCYRSMLGSLPHAALQGDGPMPYNLLATRQWMLLVPRCREHVLGISINALGFAGALLVRNDSELSALASLGPMALLRQAAVEDSPAEP